MYCGFSWEDDFTKEQIEEIKTILTIEMMNCCCMQNTWRNYQYRLGFGWEQRL